MKVPALIVCVILILLVRAYISFTQQSLYAPNQEISTCGRLSDEPRSQYGSFQFHVNDLLIQTSLDTLHYGEYVCVAGKTRELKPLSGKVSNNLLGKEKIELTIHSPKITPGDDPLTRTFSAVFTVRQMILERIYHTLPHSESALFIGIFLGDKQGFSKQMLTLFTNTGTMHIVAASGMNITLLSGMILSLLLPLFHRKIALIIAVYILLFYAVVALLSPSIVRAAIMGIGVLLAGIFGKQAHAAYLLATAIVIMLFLNPQLLFDIGFQLSIAATAGLILVKPLLEDTLSGFKRVGELPLIGEDLTTTMVSYITTIPLLLSTFGSVTLVGLVSNMFILWTIPILMSLGIVYCCIFFIPAASSLILFLAYPLLVYDLAVLNFFNLPFFSIKMENFTILFSIAYYCLFLSCLFFLKKHKKKSIPGEFME